MHRPASIGVTRKNLQNTGEGGGLNAATCLIRRGAASHWREFFRGPLPPTSPAPLQPHQFRLHHIMSLLSSLAHSSFFLSCYGFIRLCFWSDTALHPADPSTWSLGVDRPYPSPFALTWTREPNENRPRRDHKLPAILTHSTCLRLVRDKSRIF